MKRILAYAGAVALLGWTGLGLVAWSGVARRVTSSRDEHETADARRREVPADELAALHQDLRALAEALGTNLQALRDGLAADLDERASALEHRVDALRGEIGSLSKPSSPDEVTDLVREPRSPRGTAAPCPLEPSPQLVLSEAVAAPALEPGAPAAPVAVAHEEPSSAARPRASFLAFKLPSDDFRFDERRSWTVLPALSRVGFDAKTTLHDFSGVTSAIEGELQADLARPAEEPRLRLEIEAARIATGDGARDAAMREHLATDEHPSIDFELTRFEPETIEPAGERGSGRAHGRMTIRGVVREVTMPLRYSLDDARRLCVEGEMALDLGEFDVPVPSKLGLIRMEKEVEVWISLRLRVSPRTQD